MTSIDKIDSQNIVQNEFDNQNKNLEIKNGKIIIKLN